MTTVIYKLSFKNSFFIYELPVKSSFNGTWEKNYELENKYFTPMLDCTQDINVEKSMFKFYDKPPYLNELEEEEEYNKILSQIRITFNKERTIIEEVNFNKYSINKINTESIPERCLIISSILI